MDTLGDALPREIARVRDKVMPAYLEIGAAGGPALCIMQEELDRASRAMAEGDIAAMARAYQSLKEMKL